MNNIIQSANVNYLSQMKKLDYLHASREREDELKHEREVQRRIELQALKSPEQIQIEFEYERKREIKICGIIEEVASCDFELRATKIEALWVLGLKRAEIVKALDISYRDVFDITQHIEQSMKPDEIKAPNKTKWIFIAIGILAIFLIIGMSS